MRMAPAFQFHVDAREVAGGLGLTIFGVRRNLGVDHAMDQARRLEFAELQCQSPLRDPGYLPAQLAETADARDAQMPENQDFPFAAEHIHGLFDEACVGV